jgi:tight adherence protein C
VQEGHHRHNADHRPGILQRLGTILMPKSESKRASIRDMLRYAGLRSEGALQVFYGIKLAATVLGPLVVAILASVTRVLPMADAFLYVLLASILGFLVPDIVLKRLARRRQERLRRGLPDAMDLLVVCSEAGLGLNAGIQRVAGEIALTHPDLADELGLFSMQMRAGMDNRAALKDLEARTGLEDIQSLVAMLLQSMRFGTSIADTLRIYSEELRDKRLQRAQERAARVGTLMIFPLALCIMPSFLLVILGPALLRSHFADRLDSASNLTVETWG